MNKKLLTGSLVAALGVAAAGVAVTPSNSAYASAGGPPGLSCAQAKEFNAAGWNVKTYFQNKYGASWEAKYNDRANEQYEYAVSSGDSTTGKYTNSKGKTSILEILERVGPGDAEEAARQFDVIAGGEYVQISEDCEANIVVPTGVEMVLGGDRVIEGSTYNEEFGVYTFDWRSVVLSSNSGNTITVENGAELTTYIKVQNKSTAGAAILNQGSLDLEPGTEISSAGTYAVVTTEDITLNSGATVDGKIAYVAKAADDAGAMIKSLQTKLAAASKATGVSQADLAKIAAAVEAGEKVSADLIVKETGASDVSESDATKIASKISSDGKVAGYFDIAVVVSGSASGALGTLTELEEAVTVSLEIPKTYQSDVDAKNWYVVRIHDGAVEKVTGSVVKIGSGENTTYNYVFQTDKFSSYALVYDPSATSDEETAAAATAAPNSGVSTAEQGSVASLTATVLGLMASSVLLLGAKFAVSARK